MVPIVLIGQSLLHRSTEKRNSALYNQVPSHDGYRSKVDPGIGKDLSNRLS